ncbi:MAG: tryptophan-rich sensory protein [Methanospirillum sp.]|nr:tryptophan-rich sensory protein [Methanospirillum sp.]
MNRFSLRSLLLLAVCIIIPLLVGFAGSYITLPHITGWYATLAKPWLNPPDWVFGPVWTILYLLMGISLWMVAGKGLDRPIIRHGIILFAIQLLVNFLWSFIFFGLESPVGGLVTILVLFALIIATMKAFVSVTPRASFLLVPYLAWTGFALILNTMIVILNWH